MKKKKKNVFCLYLPPPPKKSEFSKFHTRRYHAWRVQNLKEICFFGDYLYFDIKIWTRLIWYQARESLKNNKFWKKKKKCVLPIFAWYGTKPPPPQKKSEFSKFHTRRYHAWRVQNLKEICFFGDYLYFDIKIWTRLIWYQARESLKNNKFWKKKKKMCFAYICPPPQKKNQNFQNFTQGGTMLGGFKIWKKYVFLVIICILT